MAPNSLHAAASLLAAVPVALAAGSAGGMSLAFGEFLLPCIQRAVQLLMRIRCWLFGHSNPLIECLEVEKGLWPTGLRVWVCRYCDSVITIENLK